MTLFVTTASSPSFTAPPRLHPQGLIGNKALTLVTLALAALSFCTPARAQSGSDADWSPPVMSGSGTLSSTGVFQGKPYNIQSQPWNWSDDYNNLSTNEGPDFIESGAVSDQGFASHAELDGTITVTRTWQGDGDPPKTIYVLEESAVHGIGGWANHGNSTWYPGWIWTAPFGSATAADAFGDAASLYDPSDVGDTSYMRSWGRRLVQVDSSSGTIALSGHINATATTFARSDDVYQGSSLVFGCFRWHVDPRAVILHRDGAHGETQDSNGTVHGDTTYSYLNGVDGTAVQNEQIFHPYFYGGWSNNPNYVSGGNNPVFNISWRWNPVEDFDTWASHSQLIDRGTLNKFGTPQQWFGKKDAVKTVTVSYTATDLNDSLTATGTYLLRVHDQYDNWRRVDSQGNPLDPQAAGDPGESVQVGLSITRMLGTPSVTIHDPDVDWNVVGIVGGGTLSGTSVLLLGLPDPPVEVATVLGLAGLAVTTAGSLPTDPHQVGPPTEDHFDAAALQQAYQNYIYNQSAYPGEENNKSSVDDDLAHLLAHNSDFDGVLRGHYGTVSVTSTVDQQMLDYYFYADEYDQGGLVRTTAPATVHEPGGCVWSYLWTYAGDVTPPSNPN